MIIKVTLKEVKDVGISAEHTFLFKCPLVEAPMYLLEAYYSYNMKYPEGLENFYTFLEYTVLEKTPPKKMPANLAQFITYVTRSDKKGLITHDRKSNFSHKYKAT